ncbi:MAG TPA: glycerophosphodiester phosphodiesterase, partial [Acidimicrobiales bacterium]|nr:glycerophosphodiester phosphodiesterase [Acidimicrobiales bacterium]
FAHRGASAAAPENTLEAFRLAVELGASGLDSDVWVSNDGEAVLDHDGLVGGWLRRRPMGTVLRHRLPGHVPTLGELYEACGTALPLSLDVKDPAALGAVLAAADAVGARGNLWLCHPDIDRLAGWREQAEGAHLVASTKLRAFADGTERAAAELSRLSIDAVNLHHTEWSGGLTTLFHRFELACLGWDAQLPRHLAELLDMGIDGVFSDHVDRMMEAIQVEMGASS